MRLITYLIFVNFFLLQNLLYFISVITRYKLNSKQVTHCVCPFAVDLDLALGRLNDNTHALPGGGELKHAEDLELLLLAEDVYEDVRGRASLEDEAKLLRAFNQRPLVCGAAASGGAGTAGRWEFKGRDRVGI